MGLCNMLDVRSQHEPTWPSCKAYRLCTSLLPMFSTTTATNPRAAATAATAAACSGKAAGYQ